MLEADENTVTLAATPLSHLGGFVAGVVFPTFLDGRSVIVRAAQAGVSAFRCLEEHDVLANRR